MQWLDAIDIDWKKQLAIKGMSEKRGGWEEKRMSGGDGHGNNSHAPSIGKISLLRDQERHRWRRHPHTPNSPIEGAAACLTGLAIGDRGGTKAAIMDVSGGGSRCDGNKLLLLWPERSLN
jgi:hypothetical protein